MSEISGFDRRAVPVNQLRSRSRASRSFGLIRGLSALGFMLCSLLAWLFAGSDVQGINAGLPFVIVLFVAEGYANTANLLKAIPNGKWSWPSYLYSRLKRLWGLLLPALLLTCLWGSNALYSLTGEGEPLQPIDGITVLAHFLFLQGIHADSLGANLPLLILSCEFWFSILLACILQFLFAPNKWIKAAYLGAAILTGWFIGMSMLAYFAIWLLGSLLSVVPLLRISGRAVGALVITASIAATVLALLGGIIPPMAHFGLLEGFFLHFTIGTACFALLYFILCLCNKPRRVTPFRENQGVAGGLARLTYPLYLNPMPVLLFFSAWLGSPSRQPVPVLLLYGAALACGLVLYAWLVAGMTEAIFRQIKALLRRTLHSLGWTSAEIPSNPQKPNRRESRIHSTKLPK